MCRMVAYLGDGTTLSPLVFGGDHPLHRQSWAPRELLMGSVNADGYGVAWYAADGALARIAEVRPIWYDPELETTLSVLVSGCVVAALRNSTPGIPVDRGGLLPLVQEGWAFVLNGFVPDFRTRHMRALRGELPDDLYGALEGTSDSETLFFLVLREMRDGATPLDALRATVDRVYERVGAEEAHLTMLLTDGARLVAVRSSNVEATNSLYVVERPAFAPGGVVLASEPTHPDERWRPVPVHGWIEVARDGTVEEGRV